MLHYALGDYMLHEYGIFFVKSEDILYTMKRRKSQLAQRQLDT